MARAPRAYTSSQSPRRATVVGAETTVPARLNAATSGIPAGAGRAVRHRPPTVQPARQRKCAKARRPAWRRRHARRSEAVAEAQLRGPVVEALLAHRRALVEVLAEHRAVAELRVDDEVAPG